jgi:hypothetical protein
VTGADVHECQQIANPDLRPNEKLVVTYGGHSDDRARRNSPLSPR